MQVNSNFQPAAFMGGISNVTKNNETTLSNDLPFNIEFHSKDINVISDLPPEVKEKITEMLPKERKLGEFKDQDWIGEAKDFQIGPDIRFAVKSKNLDFLKRIVWGPLTSAEFREVTHRLRELEIKSIESNNILKGKIIDFKESNQAPLKSEERNSSDNNLSMINLRV